jgi:NADPH-dependent 2,4-dienoyl-CoA reductase/sulfur reductase-like enzyme
VPGQPEHVLVVGAGLGGLRTAEQLRSAGYQGRISLVGAEPHPPYDRPPLSKQVLTGAWEPERAVLRDEEALDELGVRAYLGTRAVALRPGRVELADGATLHGDAIVVATGLAARRLPGQPENVHVLRTLEDSAALRATLERARSLLIVGAGFIGAEVASAARARGLDVTVLEVLEVPSARALGERVGVLCGRLFTESGVDLRTCTGPARFLDPAASVAVELADGTRLEADAGVVGVGAVPTLGWLDGSGLDAALVDPAAGIRCEGPGRVVGAADLWSVGDVAAWADPVLGGVRRFEHWTNAGDQAAAVARDILGNPQPAEPVPYFWSDQFGLKIQLVGRPELADGLVALHGDGLTGGAVRGTVVGYVTGDRLVAVVGFGAARRVARYRALLAGGAGRDEALETARSLA